MRWESFAGSTDTFAVRLAFMPDPDEGAATDPAESASWGAIQIWVDGQNLCAHVDQGELLQSSHWYLISVLEWFAYNWNPILHEEKPPNRNVAAVAVDALEATRFPPQLAEEADAFAWDEERYEWRCRHALRAARAGGLFPNIVIRRLRDMVEVSWNDEPLAGTPTGFRYSAGSGSALLAPEQVAEPLFKVLSAAADYLYENLPDHTRVVQLRDTLRLISSPGATDVRLEWLASLRQAAPLDGRLRGVVRPADEIHVRWQQIVAALNDTGDSDGVREALSVEESPLVITGSCYAALMFGSVSPTVSENDVRTLASVMVSQYSRTPVSGPLAEMSETAILDRAIRSWEQGYELAETIHGDLELDTSNGWVDVERILQELGVSVIMCRLDDGSIRACSIVGEHHVPTIVRNEASPFDSSVSSRRFTLAHELCHLLFDQSRGRRLAIASGPWAPKGLEQRANAFAAMFLMPPGLVQRAIADAADPIHDVAGVSAVAGKLRVSRRAVTEHLYNLTLMSENERDDLLLSLPG